MQQPNYRHSLYFVGVALALSACVDTTNNGPPEGNFECGEHQEVPQGATEAKTYDCYAYDFCDTLQADYFEYRSACANCDEYFGTPRVFDDCEPVDGGPPIPEPPPPPPEADLKASSCMNCHNGSDKSDYKGPGMSNPHPFGGAAYIECVDCHGGNGDALNDKIASHVPPPPEIGSPYKEQNFNPNNNTGRWIDDPQAYFNRLTLTGVDQLPDYTYDGKTYSAMDYINFLNPGDLRVTEAGRGCGLSGCHGEEHAKWVSRSIIGNTAGILSGARFAAGVPNYQFDPENEGKRPDYGFRGTEALNGVQELPTGTASVRTYPEYAGGLNGNDKFGAAGPIYQNTLYNAAALVQDTYLWSGAVDQNDPRSLGYDNAVHAQNDAANALLFPEYKQAQTSNFLAQNTAWTGMDVYNATADNTPQPFDFDNTVVAGSRLEKVLTEAISDTCGDCHGGSAGANNRYADFRASGCPQCHMEASPDGRPRANDLQVANYYAYPADPDNIAPGELPHVSAHQIRNVSKLLPDGSFLRGVSDMACAGCHQGSNRTVLQFWGIRMDQNEDVVNNVQYPANPQNFTTTENDQRLYPDAINNTTFNGRRHQQHLLVEDYDGDGRDDTPPDVHYEAGLGCIDCHMSRDLHGGTNSEGTRGTLDPTSGSTVGRFSDAVKIECSSCHGGIEGYASTVPCTTYDGIQADCAQDANGNPLRHVTMDAQGNMVLKSRLNGVVHFVPQTRDTIDPTNNKLVSVGPKAGQPVYNANASYTMGRIDQNNQNGIGPKQQNAVLANGDRGGANENSAFAHSDNMDCVSCHASWTNNCIGCHLYNEYEADPNNFQFSNITGQRIVVQEDQALFTYQTPLATYLGVQDGDITPMVGGTSMFFQYTDFNDAVTGDVNADGVADFRLVFNDVTGNGANSTRSHAFPGASHGGMMPHSIRGVVTDQNEGARQCVNCHLNQAMVDNAAVWADYQNYVAAQAAMEDQLNALRTARLNNDHDAYIAALAVVGQQQQNALNAYVNNGGNNDGQNAHFGLNTGNQNNSPFFVRQVTGQGTPLFIFDEKGCPLNPFDNNIARQGCDGISPAQNFANRLNNNFANIANAANDLDNNFVFAYDLDRTVNRFGRENVGSGHYTGDPEAYNGEGGCAVINPNLNNQANALASTNCSAGQAKLRNGAVNGRTDGPMGQYMLQLLSDPNNGVILDSWLNANGAPEGNAANYIQFQN